MAKVLADDGGALLQEPDYFGPKMFRAGIVRYLPELAPELETEPAEHSDMGVLRTACFQAVSDGDPGLARRICRFLERVLSEPSLHSEIENAVAISFVSAAELRETEAGRALWDSMPQRLRGALLEQEKRES